jgi:hypothetical protein
MAVRTGHAHVGIVNIQRIHIAARFFVVTQVAFTCSKLSVPLCCKEHRKVLHFENIKQSTAVRVFTQENILLMCLCFIQEPFSVHHKGRNVPYFVSKKIVANGRVCVS